MKKLHGRCACKKLPGKPCLVREGSILFIKFYVIQAVTAGERWWLGSNFRTAAHQAGHGTWCLSGQLSRTSASAPKGRFDDQPSMEIIFPFVMQFLIIKMYIRIVYYTECKTSG